MQNIADIIGLIFGYVLPYLTPVGEFMIGIVEFLLQYFPTDTLVPYFVIFMFTIVIGAIINSVWPGNKKTIKEKKGPKIEDSVKKCKSCGEALGDSRICPYCGAPQ